MKICGQCGAGAVKFQRLERHAYDLGGVHVEIMDSAYDMLCRSCGKHSVLVPDHEGLVAAAAVTRAHLPVKLNGTEIKFLRKATACKAATLAKMLDVAPETISRWETGKAPIGPRPEVMLRLHAAVLLRDKAPAIDVDFGAIVRMDIQPRLDNFDSALMQFELVRLKVDREKRPHWDSLLEAA